MPGYLIRHGSTEHNEQGLTRGITDVKLSQDGIIQAHSIGASLRNKPVTSLRSSDLSRASATAGILSTHIGVPHAISQRLRPIDLGAFTGVPTSQVKDEISRRIADNPTERFPNGQSYQDWLYQVWPEARKFLLDVRKGKNPALVIHGTEANMMHSLIEGKGQRFAKEILKSEPIQKPGEIWVVSHDGSGFKYEGPINHVEEVSAGAGS